MNATTATKGIVGMLSVIWAFMINSIKPIFFILIALMIIDYLTGMGASYLEGKWSSSKGFRGVIKKVASIVMVVVCILADYCIVYLGDSAGIKMGTLGIFTLLVTCWLLGVELISIIENLGRLGVDIPDFLRKGFELFKSTAEKLGKDEVSKNE